MPFAVENAKSKEPQRQRCTRIDVAIGPQSGRARIRASASLQKSAGSGPPAAAS